MRMFKWIVVCACVCGVAAAQPLAGKKISVQAPEHKSLHVPITVPFEGEAPTGVVRAILDGVGKAAPVSIRNGELTFVPEGAMPGVATSYTLETSPAEGAPAPRVRIEKQADQNILDVFIDDVHFTSYHYDNDKWRKPFLWPVHARGGVPVTRSYPMDPEGLPQDHIHHKSLWTAHGNVNGVDLWGEGQNAGYQHSDEVTFGSGDAYGWIHAKNVWQDKDRKPVITEVREYRFYATPETGRLIDVDVTFTADHGDATFGDTKEGGLVAWRMRPELSKEAAVITIVGGEQGEDKVWGKPSPWCDYSGELPGEGFMGIAVFDHPNNLRHPTSWHARAYGLNGANCFGYTNFREKEYNQPLLPENGDYLLKAGETLPFKYRVFVHNGDYQEAAVADRYADFAQTPKATWVE